jgi:hypothetical protein
MIYSSEYRPPVFSTVYWYADHIINYLLDNESPDRLLPIIVGHQIDHQNSPVLFYNCEMLTIPNSLNSIVNRCQQSDIKEVWDYSEENVKIFFQHGIQAKHVPLRLIGKNLEKIQKFIKEPIVYDFGFCGGLSPRREFILNELSKKGFKVLIINNKSGDERDSELAKCKIILNIHYSENNYLVFESVRCEPWLAVGKICISELSLDNDHRCVNVPYENIVEKCCDLIY